MFTSHTALIHVTLPISCYPYNTPFMFEHWAKWLVESERPHQNNSFSNSTVYVTFRFLITYSQHPKSLIWALHSTTEKKRMSLRGRVQSPRNV